MNVLFINPNITNTIRPNMGLAYIISFIEKHHTVKLIDLTFNARDYQEYLLSQLSNFIPDVVAFSDNSFTFHVSLSIAHELKARFPAAKFVFGGTHPTLMPENVIKHALVDAICIGDGEFTMLEYINHLHDQTWDNIEGLWYKKNGIIVKNKLRAREQNLDHFPIPNWDHWDLRRYLDYALTYLPRSLFFTASRGCIFECAFCSNKALEAATPGKWFRLRSVDCIIQEMQHNFKKYKDLDIQSFFIWDDTFGVDFQHFKSFCEKLIETGLNRYPWSCKVRVDLITEHIVQIAAAANCRLMLFGVESGSTFVRKEIYNKLIEDSQFFNACQLMQKYNIYYACTMIYGHPRDSKATLQAGINMVKKLNPLSSFWLYFKPLPKTRLADQLDEQIYEDRDFNQKHWTHIHRTAHGLTTFYLRFFRLRIMLLQLRLFLYWGFHLQKFIFLKDLLIYFLFKGQLRQISLINRHIPFDIQQKTLYRYISRARYDRQK